MARQAATEPHSQMTLKVPVRVKTWLYESAAANDRSVNKEASRMFLRLMREETEHKETLGLQA